MSAIVAAAGVPLTHATQTWVDQATAFSRQDAGPDGHATHVAARFGLGLALLRTGQHDADRPLTVDGANWIAADARLDGRHWEPPHAEVMPILELDLNIFAQVAERNVNLGNVVALQPFEQQFQHGALTHREQRLRDGIRPGAQPRTESAAHQDGLHGHIV